MRVATEVVTLAARDPSRITLVQITDSHLLQDANAEVLGVPTRETLQRVLTAIRRNHSQIDLLVHSGDIAEDAHPDSYRQFEELACDAGVPVVCVPGNHDDRTAMMQGLASGVVHINRSARIGGWLILALDSVVPGAEHGRLSSVELQRLNTELATHPGVPALVFMHHPPVEIGSEWMDGMGLRDADRLLDRITNGTEVRAVAWGHVHQAYATRRGGVRLLAAPATCFQFLPGCREMALDTLAPGYRVFTLYPDGSFDTEVVRVAEAWVAPRLRSV